jgi:hypothetical protein
LLQSRIFYQSEVPRLKFESYKLYFYANMPTAPLLFEFFFADGFPFIPTSSAIMRQHPAHSRLFKTYLTH